MITYPPAARAAAQIRPVLVSIGGCLPRLCRSGVLLRFVHRIVARDAAPRSSGCWPNFEEKAIKVLADHAGALFSLALRDQYLRLDRH